MSAAETPGPSFAADILALFDPELMRLTAVSEELLGLLDGFFRNHDRRISDEFLGIARDIAQTRSELRQLRPHDVSDALPSAGAELDAIMRDTEAATNIILGVAESLLDLDPKQPGLKDRADDLVMRIFEACSFQDLVGQRVSKVVRVLEQIESRVAGLADSIDADNSEGEVDAAEQRRRDLLLNGPAIGGPETSQAEVDALFG